MTRIHDAEGSLTTGNIPAGGAGATANTDIFLQASQSLGKRITTTGATPAGFALVDGADNDCSASGTHVGMWVWITHYGILQTLRAALCTGTTPASNYNYWAFTVSKYPPLGGWVRLWVDVTSGTTGAGTYTSSTTRCYGALCSFTGAPGGNAQNLIIDSADFVTGAALSLTGTSGVWSDFSTADENTTNQYGVFRVLSPGSYRQWARVQLGTASSLVFTDSNFAIEFADQENVSTTWNGINVDLQNASTAISWTNGRIASAGSIKGDLVVTGTSGTLTASGMTLVSNRIVTLTSAVSMTTSAFVGCGLITAAGADLTGGTFSGYEGSSDSSYVDWDVATDPDGYLDNATFTKGTASTHAIAFGATSPTTMTLRGLAFSGYNASNAQNDSTLYFARTTGTVTVSLIGCTGNISYKSAGATIVLVVDPVTVQVQVTDSSTGSNIQNARVLLQASNGTGPLPYQKSTTITRSGSTATASCTSHGLVTNDYAVVKGANESEYNGVFQVTRIDDNSFSYTVSGTPTTPATGTITTTGVALYGLTNASGIVSTTRSYTSSQPVAGNARRATVSDGTLYKQQPIAGTVSSTTGFSGSAPMVRDE